MLEQPSADSGMVSRKRSVRCSSEQHQSKTFVVDCHKISKVALIVMLGHFLVKQTDILMVIGNTIAYSSQLAWAPKKQPTNRTSI